MGMDRPHVNPQKTSQDRHWIGTLRKRGRWGDLGKPGTDQWSQSQKRQDSHGPS